MPNPWNKGHTKHTHPSVMKISKTMKSKGRDNFYKWRRKMKSSGKIKSHYPSFKKDGSLSELLGAILGDGHIEKHPRTECLRIVSHSDNKGFINRCANLIEKVFHKAPSVGKRKDSNAVDIRIYERHISKRLKIPTGSKRNLDIKVPKWILQNEKYIIRFLRGLYETDGGFYIHRNTHTYKFIFFNKNESLLDTVEDLISSLGFSPHRSRDKVQISKKKEVFKVKELLEFRSY